MHPHKIPSHFSFLNMRQHASSAQLPNSVGKLWLRLLVHMRRQSAQHSHPKVEVGRHAQAAAARRLALTAAAAGCASLLSALLILLPLRLAAPVSLAGQLRPCMTLLMGM